MGTLYNEHPVLLFTTAIFLSHNGYSTFKTQFHFHDEDIEFHEVGVVGVELLVSATLKI